MRAGLRLWPGNNKILSLKGGSWALYWTRGHADCAVGAAGTVSDKVGWQGVVSGAKEAESKTGTEIETYALMLGRMPTMRGCLRKTTLLPAAITNTSSSMYHRLLRRCASKLSRCMVGAAAAGSSNSGLGACDIVMVGCEYERALMCGCRCMLSCVQHSPHPAVCWGGTVCMPCTALQPCMPSPRSRMPPPPISTL